MFTRVFAFILLATLALGAHASRAPPRIISSGAGAEPIQIQQLIINTSISGGMAETTVRMVLHNPNARQLEGTVEFPLADGQQITAFALDINGEMRPAVPVGKARGREVFDAIERRQVDPGLLEVTQGNNFKLRVYPIFPRSTRTVEITYAESLQRQGQDWAYRLPLAYGMVNDLDLTLSVSGASAAPVLSGSGPKLRFEGSEGAYTATLKKQHYQAQGDIAILSRAAFEPRVYTERFDDATWFVAEVPVQSKRSARPRPRVLGLLWDSSGSGANRAIDVELAELDRYFTALGNVQVRLTRLRDRAEAQQVFQVVRGNWSALRRALEGTVYDGASALADWTPQAEVDQYLLFSDGLSNYSNAPFPELAARQKLFTLNSALSADTARLAALAERRGGQFIAVSRNAPGAAADALLYEEARIEHIAASGATDIEAESRTVRNGLLRVAGRQLANEAELVLTVLNGGKRERIVLPIGADAPAHPRAAATWAALRLRALEADFEINRAEIGRIGRRFAIPTRETSLIVLELLSDYVNYEIRPPGKLGAEYDSARATIDARRASERGKHLENVVEMYQQRKQWWKRKYVPRQDVRKQGNMSVVEMHAPGRSAKDSRVVESATPMVVMAPAAEATASPPPVADRERVQVSGSRLAQKAAAARPQAPSVGITLKKWTPNAPYMQRFKGTTADRLYAVYLDLKPDYANSTAFYLDAADVLLQSGQRELGLRVLSNLAEMALENRAALRILGYRLLQAGAAAQAVPVFEQVVRIAEEEPQSFRDLGLALAETGRTQEAINTLYEVIVRPWDQRFPDIETVTLAELNAIVARSSKRLDVSRIDPRLRDNLPLDLRVVMTWDADNSDMDLYVTDPAGEQSFYGNPLTSQGARMSRDFTGGYGPEEFALRHARPGKYRISAKFYGHRQQVLAGATTVQVKLTTGFGTPRQNEQLMTLRLQDQRDMVFVGEFEVK